MLEHKGCACYRLSLEGIYAEITKNIIGHQAISTKAFICLRRHAHSRMGFLVRLVHAESSIGLWRHFLLTPGRFKLDFHLFGTLTREPSSVMPDMTQSLAQLLCRGAARENICPSNCFMLFYSTSFDLSFKLVAGTEWILVFST